MLVDVGRVVANKYELVRLLGRGSMGEVWGAHHRTLGEHVALKLLTPAPGRPAGTGPLPGNGADPFGDALGQGAPEGFEMAFAEASEVAAARFLFEAQIAARLSRKTRHIVQVTDHGEDDGLAYLVMELLDGDTLEALLVRDSRVPLERARTIVNQVARALEQAHAEGVVHRDLKPANVFLTHDEDGQLLVKVLDFGIARATQAHWLKAGTGPSNGQSPGGRAAFTTAKGFVFGTPGYMSPEQARASSELDHRCDLWALATIAYQMVTGMLPVEGDDADELLRNLCAGRIVPLHARSPGAPHALAAFFDRAFAERAEARFATATALVEAFERACGLPAEVPASLSRTPASSPPPALYAAPSLLDPEPRAAFALANANGRSVAADTVLTRTARRGAHLGASPLRAGKAITWGVVTLLVVTLAAALVLRSHGERAPAPAAVRDPVAVSPTAPVTASAPAPPPSTRPPTSPAGVATPFVPPPVAPLPAASNRGTPQTLAAPLPPSSAPPPHRPTRGGVARPRAADSERPTTEGPATPDRNEVF